MCKNWYFYKAHYVLEDFCLCFKSLCDRGDINLKIKLSKKYSLILIFVMAFSFFAPTIVSANEFRTLALPNYVVVEKQTGKSVCDVGEANVGLEPEAKNYIYNLKAREGVRDVAAANEEVSDAETMADEDDNEYNNDAKNLDNNKKKSNKNINQMDINEDLYDQGYEEDEGDAYDKKSFSEEDIYGEDPVIKFSSNLEDETDIYDQQAGEKGDDVDKQIADPEKNGYTLDGMKPSKDLIPSTENNDITNLFPKNANVSPRLNNRPAKPRNSIERFRRLGKSKPKNASNILRLSSESVGIFSNFKEKKDIKIKNARPFSNDLYLHNPKTGDIGIIIWVGFMAVSVLGTSDVVKFLKKEK